MSGRELVVLLERREIGRVHRDARSRLRFVYDDGWRLSDDAYPLSLSLPLTAAEHAHAQIEAFLWGLLPDNDRVIDSWARQFNVGANAFSLLGHVGTDCAGAVQFAPPEDLETLLRAGPGAVQWLSNGDIADRLRSLRKDSTAGRLRGDSGQFSLAGAQAKTALLLRGERWGIPTGRVPTTHILKPPIAELRGHVENEHFCLELAWRLGLPSARSSVRRFGDEIAVVIERYDRARAGRATVRLHQEDTCQALGVMPVKKHESEGGPSVRSIVDLLRDVSTAPVEDTWTFLSALGFNWLIGGTDAHAKNYSLLIGRDVVRLAPLYDLGSILPYPAFSHAKTKLAMKVGTKYLLAQIGLRQWIQTARELRIDADQLIARLRDTAERLPDAAEAIRARAQSQGLDDSILQSLTQEISQRARRCRAELD